jgi:hypothetical protein
LTSGAAIAIAVIGALAIGDTKQAIAADGVVCPRPAGPWLRVAFAGDAFVPALRAGVLEQLGVDLHRHDLVVCAADAANPTDAPDVTAPLADIALTLGAGTILSVEVRDAVTDKRIGRDLPLASVPRDALALSIALAAEELLHASWIEAALVPAGQPAAASASTAAPSRASPPAAARPVPAAVRAVNAEEIARIEQDEGRPHEKAPLGASIELVGAVDRSTGGSAAAGQTDLGGDLRFAFGGRLTVTARLGARTAPAVSSDHGKVEGRELLAGAGLAYAVVPREARWGAELAARADALDVQFTGVASPGVVAESGSALGAALSGAIEGWGRLGGPWRIVAELAAGAPLHAVTATDAGNAATGVAGLSLSAALGLGVDLF